MNYLSVPLEFRSTRKTKRMPGSRPRQNKAERPQSLSGELLALIAASGPMSRSSLLSASGLSRVTVTQRLASFIASGLVVETDETQPSGGRPSRLVCVNAEAAALLVANIGESHIRLALANLQLTLQAQVTIAFDIDEGPKTTLERISSAFDGLLRFEKRQYHNPKAAATWPACPMWRR